jgi:hypothetical protein
MAAKLTRLTHKIAIQLHLVAESSTICSSRSRRPVRKLLCTPSYVVSLEEEHNCSVSKLSAQKICAPKRGSVSQQFGILLKARKFVSYTGDAVFLGHWI